MHGAKESGLGSPDGDVEDVGDLEEAEAEVVLQHHHGAMVRTKALECPIETVSIGNGRFELGGCSPVIW